MIGMTTLTEHAPEQTDDIQAKICPESKMQCTFQICANGGCAMQGAGVALETFTVAGSTEASTAESAAEDRAAKVADPAHIGGLALIEA